MIEMAQVSVEEIFAENCDVEKEIIEENEQDSPIITTNELHEAIQDLSTFKVIKVLRNSSIQKQVAVLGTIGECKDEALLILEKKTFPDEQSSLEEEFLNGETTLNKLYKNDIYTTYDVFPAKKYSGLAATLIYPATPKHIEKFSPIEYYIIEETPEIYENVSLPRLSKKRLSLSWVDNILNGTAENDRVIFDDENLETGFVLVKDLKWNEGLSTLHIIAITRKPLKSIRELNGSHLPLLRNIKKTGTKAIVDKYNIPTSQLRIFFHYQPSYFRLHVHFTAVTVENAGAIVERGHMLSTVISNIELMSDYYQKATITFRVPNPFSYQPYQEYMEQKQKDLESNNHENNEQDGPSEPLISGN